MTKHEADFIGSMNMCDEISNEAYKKIMCNCEVEESQPCEDCVSREYLIDKIGNVDGLEGYDNSNLFAKHYMNLVKNAPSVTPQQTRWIPVSERLPEETDDLVLGLDSLGVIHITEIWDDCGQLKWYADGRYDVPIIAWVPLPQPYKAESDEERSESE